MKKSGTNSLKSLTDWSQQDVEDLAAEIAWMQDAGGSCNFRNKQQQSKNKTEQRPQVTELNIHGYQKHWVESTDTGWQIRVASDTELIKINCHFPDKVRDSHGRLKKK